MKKTILVFASSFAFCISLPAALVEITFSAGPNTAFAPSFGQFSSSPNDLISGGATASSGLELLAELGDPSMLISERGGGSNLFGGPTLFGATNSTIIDVDASTPWFNFAAMVLPSNDWFVATGGLVDPINISSILGGSGDVISVSFNDFYDAGTELEDFNFAAPPGAFIPGFTNMPPGGTDQNGTIGLVDFSGGNPFEDFANIPAGFDVSAFDPTGGPVGTLTFRAVPEPSSTLLTGLAFLATLARRRR